ncbi:glycosyltransferase [Amphibacillus cookii]|uniref:glycosyltransferase n=1 Tax=Amphibacillus cookii TaxID=767787 RepID=UPI00195670CD|nr:glycosyltransferase [Amphibacillus cookii]MBM7541970.1 hypothetical protein [Amphibacillus cookii]
MSGQLKGSRLKLLILIKRFDKHFPKHRMKYEMIKALEQFADVYYWHQDGDIKEIINQIGVTPDFILHYDTAWNYTFAPHVEKLDEISIPKGCFVIDVHWKKQKRVQYFNENQIDLIFSVSKYPFLKAFPSFEKRWRWVPFSIDPTVFKDWQQSKEYAYLLMGLVHYDGLRYPAKGRYAFREQVLSQLGNEDGFVFFKHPGHLTKKTQLLNEQFAQHLNRAEIFFTCGSVMQYPVSKFFEAPACRTLLLAESNPDIEELGFIDGEHFVACNQTNVYQNALYYHENPKERQEITDKGYAFVQQWHTNQVRAQQWIKEMEVFLHGS